MNFARRAEGIKSARAVFKMAREDKRSTYHVFVAAALMEFYCSKVSTCVPVLVSAYVPVLVSTYVPVLVSAYVPVLVSA